MIVWNNTGWKYVFKNFYGIPIRLYSGGEVIGILRAENKWTYKNSKNENRIIKNLLGKKNTSDFIKGIRRKINEKYENLNSLNLSFLALVYLENDLESSECKKQIEKGFEKLIFIPYPDYINKGGEIEEDKKINISSLIPADEKKRPPMQLFTKSIEDERRLWEQIDETRKGKKTVCGNLYKQISKLYKIFEQEIFKKIEYKREGPSINIKAKAFNKRIGEIIPGCKLNYENNEIENFTNSRLPDFHFKISLSFNGGEQIDFYMVVPPTRDDVQNGNIPLKSMVAQKDEDYKKRFYNHYKEVNQIWMKNKETKLEEYRTNREKIKNPQGESDIFDDEDRDIRVTDLILDRLAARVQAFALALPLTEFSPLDSYKLKWAAYEIGRLIEREISYRANRHDNPIPLTAMEFFRIPISDLSFVDDLRSRRVSLGKISDNINVYIKNIIFDMEMSGDVEYSSRIKGYRSMFQRIGERFEGYVRGNIALWVFILSLVKFGKNNDIDKDEWDTFLKKLGKFRKNIIESMNQKDAEFFNRDHEQLKELFGDLKFDSPSFMDDEEMERLLENNLVSALDEELTKKTENHKKNLVKALTRICENLKDEGFQTENDVEEGVDAFFEKNRKLLDDLLIRNYSHFFRDSISLLIQIANLLESLGKNNYWYYKNFYRKCRKLREFLCSSPQQLEGKKKYHLEKIFSIKKNPDNKEGEWSKIKEFINKNKTGTAFPGEDNFVKLIPRSIYKRIRMLNNILHRQVPSTLLDWELGRFDLYGARMNCLYKNQVFALYEKIWNKGDPFFIYEPQAKEFTGYYRENEKIDTNKYRQRWLCLRTSFLQGEYNACQISTLIDPKTADFGYWEKMSGYNLKCVQYVLGKIFKEFEKIAAEKYINYSWHRHLISKCYSQLYKDSADLFQWTIQEHVKKPDGDQWFGSFLFASVINLLMLMVGCKIDDKKKNGKYSPDDIKNRHDFEKVALKRIFKEMKKKIGEPNLFFNILDKLYMVIKESGAKYSEEIKESFMGSKLFSEIQFKCKCKTSTNANPNTEGKKENRGNSTNANAKGKNLFDCENGDPTSCCIYEWALKLVNNIIDESNSSKKKLAPRDKEIFEKIKVNLEKERNFFIGLKVAESIKGFQMPLFYFDINQKDPAGYPTLNSLDKIRKNLKKKLGKGNQIEEKYWAFVYRTLKRIRREQKSYLFDKGDKSLNHSGLWIRDKNEVLDRIKNYMLLFSKIDINENKDLFIGWTAHDLYYYIHSLIPMEMQVRTELANTFAVQYHDSMYKVQPPPGTEFPHSMIKTAGEGLDKIDREIEVDYEDYILKYHHRVDEEEKDKDS